MPNNSYDHTDMRLVKKYSLVFKSGATGAVPATFIRGKNTVSVTRNATGKYAVVVKRNGADLTDFDCFVEQASFSISGACYAVLVSQNVNTALGGFVFQIINAAGTAVDPANGDIVKVNYSIKHSSGLL